ncbi:putative phosphoenolpyruvate synthase [Trichonephila clavata]|uniref:Putative phosphoenolpyruvate synthase n=1 Tax=Trichonephila clavata TaxID=2740835 RepID=A0A8X6LMB3_TRICU|nr:putative phosphoenolpyruvate synthase [Trichonephila clavata]
MIISFLIIIFTAPLQFIYWMKWIVSYAAIRLHKSFGCRKFELYDVTAKNDPYKSGLLIPEEEKRLESPFSDSHLLEALDEVYFFGVNSKSECILVRIARIYNQMADAWIYLKLANGKTYNLRETIGYQESSDGKTFSCGKLQMHYLLPMRRWRIFYCGMLNETSENKENEESVFVKFVFLWKASSEAYDCTLDTNPKGFASALAKADWKGSFKPPVDELITPSNFYAQTGIMAGTVSINDGEDYEMYLFGEKVRNLAKMTDVTECKCISILGNTPTIGHNFHLSTMSMKNSFEDLHIGFVVDPDGEMEYLKELNVDLKPSSTENTRRSFKAKFSTVLGEHYEMSGNVIEPIILNMGYGLKGFLEVSMVEFTVRDKKGIGIIFSG